MIQNKVFDSWLNARGFDPNHPLLQRLKKFSALGADLDVIFALCCMLALSNAVRSCAIETKKRLADRSRRWRKELGGLLSSHPGGKLRLNEVAHRYTISIIRSTLDHLTAKGLIDSTVVNMKQFSVSESSNFGRFEGLKMIANKRPDLHKPKVVKK